MKTFVNSALLVSIMLFASIGHAEWTHEFVPLLNKWVVSDGEQEIRYNKEKSAKKAARALNKNEKKNEESGFWNDGSDYCQNPLNEC